MQAERMGASLDEGTVAGVIEGARAAGEMNDSMVSEHVAGLRATDGIACTAGCASCCTLGVAVSFAETARLADFVERTFTPAAHAALNARLEAHCDANALLAPDARAVARRPCPLLVDSRCSAYEARPLACRGWNSAKVEPCRDDAEHPGAGLKVPVHVEIHRAARDIAEGVRDAARNRGLDDTALDLPESLLGTLKDIDGATRRWLGGAMAPERQQLARRARR
jgi:hypothetical protein